MNWRYRETVLALCTLAFFATMVGRLVISPVVPMVTDEFGVSNSVIGIALTGMWMAYFLSQFPSGLLADRYGERIVILVAVGGTAAASVFLAIAPLFWVFLLGTILLGGVAGLHYSVATTLLTRTYDEIGTAIGVHNGGGPLAGLIAPPIAAWIAVQYGWRPAIAVGAAVAVPVFLLFGWRVQPTEPQRPDERVRDRLELEPVLELLSRPKIAFPIVLSILAAFVWQATASFLPTFLMEHREQSPELASLVFGGYFVVQAVTQVGVGAVSDRYGRDLATGGCMILGSIGFGLLVAVPGSIALGAAVLLIGTGLGWGAALLPRFMDVLGDAERGAGFGLVRTVYGFIGALGSVCTGLLADVFGWGVAFAVLGGLLALVLVALFVNWVFSLGY
ncbi:MFS transporter [Halobiforma nitratireducens]|uniref:Major facilitator superfamily protein n=1 Tax=Halobiforma nitratireducens JCM 10879 TaxID=1227454 RepID=M0LYF8_9EURY|nr:MFS transporter [Halobiforma nitratireducens]EMA38213.1 major facilitator superfamily protein [Halobiforma nitratireducens JCM 10879]